MEEQWMPRFSVLCRQPYRRHNQRTKLSSLPVANVVGGGSGAGQILYVCAKSGRILETEIKTCRVCTLRSRQRDGHNIYRSMPFGRKRGDFLSFSQFLCGNGVGWHSQFARRIHDCAFRWRLGEYMRSQNRMQEHSVRSCVSWVLLHSCVSQAKMACASRTSVQAPHEKKVDI